MTRLLVFVLINFYSSLATFSQDFLPFKVKSIDFDNFKKADSLFNVGKYKLAKDYYSSSALIEYFPYEKYKFAICLWLENDTINSQIKFKQSVDKGLYFNSKSTLEASPFLRELSQNDSIYNALKNRVFRDSLCSFPFIRTELLKLKEVDQRQRVSIKLSDEEFRINDSLNQIELASILKKINWPGFNEVGYLGEGAAFLIAQHADNNLEFQKNCLDRMIIEFNRGNISLSSFAMLIDRYLVNSSKPQIFGTQVLFDEKINSFKSKSCLYPDEVNNLRSLYMLTPIEDYLDYMNRTH